MRIQSKKKKILFPISENKTTFLIKKKVIVSDFNKIVFFKVDTLAHQIETVFLVALQRIRF